MNPPLDVPRRPLRGGLLVAACAWLLADAAGALAAPRPKPTKTPRPTATPQLTATPRPTATPAATPCAVAPDADGDCVADAADDCPAAWNPDQADGDGDGTGDACDDSPGTPPARTRFYEMDPLHRLVASPDETFSYDRAGNRVGSGGAP